MNNNKRAAWGSKLGFIMAAIGSSVGLGNIWAFPYKLVKTGGFAFLLVYLILALLIGVVAMTTELAIGRKTKLSPCAAYKKINSKFAWVGMLQVLSPLFVEIFYFVLGAYCVEYIFINISELSIQSLSLAHLNGSETFSIVLSKPMGAIIFTALFILVNLIILKKDISNGIEKFNKYGMPALAIIILIIIAKVLTLKGAGAGIAFMLKPNFKSFTSFKGFIHILSIAGGQMFLSLSISMGILITFGSYTSKDTNLKKSSLSILFFDTLVALLAGLAVIPAAFALGGKGAEMAGPKLLFVTMQNVFLSMGKLGPLFGIVFYTFVVIAALSSTISMCEVLISFVTDQRQRKGKEVNRGKCATFCILFISIGSLVVAWEGLGANKLWVPLRSIIQCPFTATWLDFFDFLSEGFMMPLAGFLMSIIIGWIKRPKYILDEVGHTKFFDKFYTISIKFIVPISMLFILAGQLSEYLNLGWF